MNTDFEPPRKLWTILATVGGVVTACSLIVGLEMSQPLSEKIAKLDGQSVKAKGQPVTADQLAKVPVIGEHVGRLTPTEVVFARQAWSYFGRNWHEKTGMVNSADNFPSVTMWDQAAGMAALVSAYELGIVTNAEFDSKMSQALQTLVTLPLYRNELPNKVYNAKTLMPVGYGKLTKREEIGWSAIDIGRMAIWLKIIGDRYPRYQPQTAAIWQRWQVQRLTKNGQMFGTANKNGKEEYNQEGRFGYENYAAYGLQLWGLDLKKALDFKSNIKFVDLYGQGVPYDKRDFDNSEANNYVLSEPYILDGIETGFQSLPKAYADRVLAAQEARYQATNHLTAVTEDNLDQPPYFVYGTLYVNGQPWATYADKRQIRNDLRFLSTKAAIGWHVLYNTPYTHKLSEFVQINLKADIGWYNGFYESLNRPNRALTANNNGVILESLLYKKVGKPLLLWAKE
jgi:Protein of unknown function (DUF3131)